MKNTMDFKVEFRQDSSMFLERYYSSAEILLKTRVMYSRVFGEGRDVSGYGGVDEAGSDTFFDNDTIWGQFKDGIDD